jgi:enoyl-CoA hydratase
MENQVVLVVLYSKENNIGVITINRPEVKNPLNMSVFRAIDEALDATAADEGLRALVVTGAGNAFVSGADINELLALNTQEGWMASRFQQSVFNKLERLRKPSIAVINGFAMGGGLELALSCTFRIASTKAKIGFPELGLGIIPAFGGTGRLVRTVGYAKASELILFRRICVSWKMWTGFTRRSCRAVCTPFAQLRRQLMEP